MPVSGESKCLLVSVGDSCYRRSCKARLAADLLRQCGNVSREQPVFGGGDSQIRSTRRTILLVDDNRADVELVKWSLTEGPDSPQILVSEDGVEALKFLREARSLPDIILLDLNLPRKGGHELLSEIKADSRLRTIPVVVLTSSNAERDISSAYAMHANCYLTKPMDIDHFANTLRSVQQFWFSVVKLPSTH